MKIYVISDIKSQSESVIPYALRLAAYMEAEVEVIHMIDTRVQQGVSSSYGDSHTVAPAEKLSHGQIVEREKNSANKALNDFLSRETSVLNYPLRINVRVEVNSVENKITEDLNNDPSGLLVVSKIADEYTFLSQKEIVDACKSFKGLSLVLSPGTVFQKFSNVLLPAGLHTDDLESYLEASAFMNRFHPVINVIAHQNGKKDMEAENWMKKTETIFLNASLNLKTINSANFDNEFIEYAELIKPDLILIFGRERSLMKSLFKKELLVKLVEKHQSPVLYYSG